MSNDLQRLRVSYENSEIPAKMLREEIDWLTFANNSYLVAYVTSNADITSLLLIRDGNKNVKEGYITVILPSDLLVHPGILYVEN